MAPMTGFYERIVAFCVARAWLVVTLTLALAAFGVFLTITRFAINTDTARLISPEVPWRQNEISYAGAFPQLKDSVVAVIDAKTAEAADEAAERLNKGLAGQPKIVRAWRPDSNEFLDRAGLLLIERPELKATLTELQARRGFLGPLAADPSLRGLMLLLSNAMDDAGAGDRKQFEGFVEPLGKLAAVIEDTLAGKPARLSWQDLFANTPPTPADIRRLVLIQPQLDFRALEPGRGAVNEIRAIAKTTVEQVPGAKMRLTGSVPLADEEFATVAENYELNTAVTLLIVAFILFMALRSGKIIFAVLSTLLIGLVITSGVGLLLIGQFNLISIAFAVLFIGLGVDFGIQFATKYREKRHLDDDLSGSLLSAIREIGRSLGLAAISLVAGFFCFLPTQFRGVSELGFIAGIGMIIAFICTITFLPALLAVIKPSPEKKPIETASLAAVDDWILHNRKLVLIVTALVVLAGMPALMKLEFDSNPMHLRSAKVESVATYLDLAKDPRTAPTSIQILSPSVEAAAATAEKLQALPQVARAVTMATFLPADQDQRRADINAAAAEILPALNTRPKAPASDAQTVKELDITLDMLKIAETQGAPPPMVRFTRAVEALMKATPTQRAAAEKAIFQDFGPLIQRLKLLLSPQHVTQKDIPAEMQTEWISPAGQARIEVLPKGDSNDNAVLASFAHAVRAIAPNATGAPITVVEAGKTIVQAFLEAGLLAFVAIFIILYVAMRRVSDVALALGPLVLAGIMSLQAAQLVGLSLDFANIIALPLMFGVGVAFHIYYLIAWRNGMTDMLASSLTRAIFFSSLTTGVAFGSLCLSSHPGTAGMGKLLAISLVFTLLAAFIIVPAFLGPPPGAGERAS